MHTLWITPACCLPHTISRSPNASQKWHHYLHFTRAVGLLKQNKVPEHHSGKMDAFGRVFVLLCFPCMSTGHVLAVKAWPPDVQNFLTKVQCLFFFPCPGKLSSWKLMPQPGKAKHMEVSHFADGKHPGDQRSSTRLGRKPGLQPTFPDLWGSAKPTKPPCPSLCALYFLYSFHGFQEDLKPRGHGFRSVCSAGWLVGPPKPRALL